MTKTAAATKAGLALVPAALLVALAHAAYRRGEAYALLGVLVDGRLLLASTCVGLAVGFAVGARVSRGPVQGLSTLLAAAAILPAANVGAFVVTSFASDARAALLALGALSGLAWGTSAAGFVAWLRRVAWWGGALVSWMSLRGTLVVVASLAVVVGIGGRAGALRFPLLVGTLLAIAAHEGLGLVPLASGRQLARRAATAVGIGLGVSVVTITWLSPLEEATHLGDPIVSGGSTDHSRVSITSGRGALQVHLDGVLRLSSLDAHRRREALVHPGLLAAPSRRRVLVLGGGDGTATREALRYPDVAEVVVVEPDAAWLTFGRRHAVLRFFNGGALSDPRVTTARADLFAWLRQGRTDDPPAPHDFDVVVMDLADPDTPERSKIFSAYALRLVAARLAEDGVVAVTLPSPEAQRRAFASMVATLRDVLPHVVPYKAPLPTAGVAGFALASRRPIRAPERPPEGLAWLDATTLRGLFALARDETLVEGAEKNLLFHQVLVRYREEDEPR